MKIQYASDLHLELSGNSKYVKEIPFEVTGDILVLAGDAAYLGDKSLPNSKFWKWASENYREVFLVPGNYEYYGFGDVLESCICDYMEGARAAILLKSDLKLRS